MATRTGVGRDLSPVKKGIKVGVGVWHCCASSELDRQNILLMDYITGLIVLGINITILMTKTVRHVSHPVGYHGVGRVKVSKKAPELDLSTNKKRLFNNAY